MSLVCTRMSLGCGFTMNRSQSTPKHFLIILKLTLSTPDLLFIFSEKNASFNSFIDEDLDSILTFTLLIYVSNILDDFGI